MASDAARPQRIQRQRTKGWKTPDNTVYVGRPTKWGNPFSVRTWGLDLSLALFKDACDDVFDPGTVPAEFEDWRFTEASQLASVWRQNLKNGYGTRSVIAEDLRGKNLACWCPLDQPCHADILLEIANAKGNPDA